MNAKLKSTPQPNCTQPELGLYQRFRLTIAPQAKLRLPDYSGSMLRGIFGHALLRHSCRCGNAQKHTSECTYSHVFEGAGPTGIARGIDRSPRFVITPPPAKTYSLGDFFTLDLVVFGINPGQLSEIKEAWQDACVRGMGTPPVRCTLVSFEKYDRPIPLLSSEVTLDFKTPWLMKRHGRILCPSECSAADFLWAINHRQALLNANFNLGLPTIDTHALATLGRQILIKKDLKSVTWQRYSSRQTRQHPLSGMLGRIRLSHPKSNGLAPLSALLGHGTMLHAGAKTSFGLGAYELEANH